MLVSENIKSKKKNVRIKIEPSYFDLAESVHHELITINVDSNELRLK